MGKENFLRQQHLRQLVAQHAARMMIEEGVADYAYAKRKAARQLSMDEVHCLPANAEIEQELRLYNDLYGDHDQVEHLRQLRDDALTVMRMLERFNPQITGAVLEGTAGRYAETDIHLFADSLKDVDIFLLNNQIPYQMAEKTFRFGNERKKIPVFSLDGPHGVIRLSVFTTDDAHNAPRSLLGSGALQRASAKTLETLLHPKTRI